MRAIRDHRLGLPWALVFTLLHGATAHAMQPVVVEQQESDGEEQALDLDALEEEEQEEQREQEPSDGHAHAHAHTTLGSAKLKLFFDFILEHQLDSDVLAFTRDHAHVMVELQPTEDLYFRTDIAYEPAFFELGWHVHPSMELRAGKVLVPFGQNAWHHLIGGRVDEQSLFLPVIWSDYGLVFKHQAYDGEWLGIDYAAYVVNGFEGTTEPLNVRGDAADNNFMKGVGLRPRVRLGTAVAFGTSWYFDSWDADQSLHMVMYGFDVDLGYGLFDVSVLRAMRLRAEIAWAEVQLPDDQNYYTGMMPYGLRRSGYNIELSFRIRPWLRLRYREGRLNADSRKDDANDLRVHEPAIVAIFGPVRVALVLELHTHLYDNLTPPPEDDSKVYARIFFQY